MYASSIKVVYEAAARSGGAMLQPEQAESLRLLSERLELAPAAAAAAAAAANDVLEGEAAVLLGRRGKGEDVKEEEVCALLAAAQGLGATAVRTRGDRNGAALLLRLAVQVGCILYEKKPKNPVKSRF